jgi:hypothetical protein
VQHSMTSARCNRTSIKCSCFAAGLIFLSTNSNNVTSQHWESSYGVYGSLSKTCLLQQNCTGCS